VFDKKVFKKLIYGGEWAEAEDYLSHFVDVDLSTPDAPEAEYNIPLVWEMRKHRYLDALYK
jgi:hypothetical protein